jgi:hypothetical protein
VSRWTEKPIWDAVLTNVNIVVSTYAVLYEALCHASINMEALALIVFDEGQSLYIPKNILLMFLQHIIVPRKAQGANLCTTTIGPRRLPKNTCPISLV